MVSVIIPNYNHAQYLNQRIDSVLNQTYQNFEIIILDDCSKDNSREIINAYKNNNKITHIIYNKNNSGSTFKQWEKGISLAKGEYIWIAESDDCADISFLEKIMHSFSTYKSNVCFSQSKLIDENNDVLSEKLQILEGSTSLYKEFLLNKLLYGNSIYNASMVVFEKEYVSQTIWNDISKLKFCGDWLFWVQVISRSQGIISEVKEPLNYFRVHSSNVSGKSEVRGLTFLEGFPISKKLFNFLRSISSQEFNKEWFDKWYSYRHYYLFSKNVNLQIFLMFLINRPTIAFLELKRLLSRLFQKE